MYDEVDKYPVTREGDPIDIGDERTAKFSNWLSVRACSPTVKDESRIEASYLESDQRRASVACPHCGHRQFPDFFKHVEWEKSENGHRHRTETARLCEACGAGWSEGQRRKALQTIRWHQTRPFECCGEQQAPLEAYDSAWRLVDEGAVDTIWDWWSSDLHAVYRAKCRICGDWAVPNEHAGFRWQTVFPWAKDSPAHIARKWIAADGDEDKKQVWYNTQNAQTYRKHAGREIVLNGLLARRENWPAGTIPDGVALLTAGIDIQDYRVEIEVVGWGRDEESWSIEHHVIDGEMSDPSTRTAVEEYLLRTWQRNDGTQFEIRAACIDPAAITPMQSIAFRRRTSAASGGPSRVRVPERASATLSGRSSGPARDHGKASGPSSSGSMPQRTSFATRCTRIRRARAICTSMAIGISLP
jgi:phage terminase large subunit GpA-like protein